MLRGEEGGAPPKAPPRVPLAAWSQGPCRPPGSGLQAAAHFAPAGAIDARRGGRRSGNPNAAPQTGDFDDGCCVWFWRREVQSQPVPPRPCSPSFRGWPAALGAPRLWLPPPSRGRLPQGSVSVPLLLIEGPPYILCLLVLTGILTTSAESLFPAKVTFTVTRLGLQPVFMGTPFKPQRKVTGFCTFCQARKEEKGE